MRKPAGLALVTTISAALLFPGGISPVSAQTSGTTGRIAKFTSGTTLGNSVMIESGGRIGIGTASPNSKLEISGQNALKLSGFQPFMTLSDSNAANARHVIQSVGGGLNLLADDYLKNTNPFAFVRVDKTGKVGLGTANPQRLLQIGPDTNALFTIEASDESPRAGFIRFGDKTGWQLNIGRSRESSGGPLNTGSTGWVFRIKDNGEFGPVGWPLGPVGNGGPLCRMLNNVVTPCPSSSLRYKTSITPYTGGLDVIEKLQPITFTRNLTGNRDMGLGAEDVAAVEPLFTFNNEHGEVEGVKYELLTTVLVNAVKEQQEQIERQHKLIEQLQSSVARLEQANERRVSGQ